MASTKREHVLIAASIAAFAGLCGVVLLQFLGILPDLTLRSAAKPTPAPPPAVAKMPPAFPPLPAGVVHVADAYDAINALAANDLGKEWWKGTVRGSVVLVDVAGPGQANVVIADLRQTTTNTVTIACGSNGVEKFKRGDVITVKGRGRERDAYRYGSVRLEALEFLPSGN